MGIETDANFQFPNGIIRLIRFGDYPSANINGAAKNIFTLSPTPLTDRTTLIIPQDIITDKLYIEIFNIRGQKVRNYNTIDSHEVEILKGDLKAGLYFIKIKSPKLSETVKFIVN